MKEKVIVMGGAPQVGKCEILCSLSKLTGGSLSQPHPHGDRLTELSIATGNNLYKLRAATGSLLYPQEMYSNLLSTANAVVYVISLHETTPGSQQESFQSFGQAALQLNKMETQIPWLFVRNKCDLPPNSIFPKELLPVSACQTVATRGDGIAVLWEEIRHLL